MPIATAAPRRAAPPRTRAGSANAVALALDTPSHNVARPERIGSVAFGAALVSYGVRRRDPAGMIAALVGGAFVLRGATGHCPVYRAIGVSTGSADAVLHSARDDVTGRAATVNARKAVKVERAVTIEADRQALYDFWRDFENLPRFMEHLVSVRVASATRSHWVAKAPAGRTVEWDAEIINEIPGSLIAWKSAAGAEVPNAGSVHFADTPGGRGTVVRVVMDAEPPAGKLGLVLAKLFGEDPDREVREDLRKFKQLMETGAVTTSARRREDSAYVGSTPTK
ncbi:MAG TPA: SRPBCC family protein [Gemmatimonadaceae bacterium]|nr:SRPBCC family protein [Gemmatimonadaceae bacterium]